MRRHLAVALVLLVAAGALLAGSRTPVVAAEGDALFDLGVLPEVDVTGKQMVDALQAYVTEFPRRVTGTPTELLSALEVESELSGYGYETEIHALPATIDIPQSSAAPLLRAVTAFRPGTTKPDEVIMLIGHYDVVAQTVEGTYDNGTGTNMLRFLAKELAQVQTNRSILIAIYNGEEQGALSSQRHVAELKAAGTKIVAALGFDMVGLSYPMGRVDADACLCMWHGPNDGGTMVPILRHVNYDFLEFPEAPTLVAIKGNNTRNSDERMFATAGIPTLRWAGMRTAGAYDGYHQQTDTLATITTIAGGLEFFEAGTLNTLTSAYYTWLELDNALPVPVAQVTLQDGTATLDATASTDLDGALSDFRWEFADGSTATGPVVTYTPASAGETATLVVGDNLHPGATSTLSVQISQG